MMKKVKVDIIKGRDGWGWEAALGKAIIYSKSFKVASRDKCEEEAIPWFKTYMPDVEVVFE